MPEATIICCDCSEYMRNGDFHPTRFASQSDAVGLISNAKTQQNHENTVGLIAMYPNQKANVLVNCTQDIGRVLLSLGKMKIGDNTLIKSPSIETDNKTITTDSINILVALQTAQLALKHRKNKKQDQRIILFVGSPITKSQSEKLLIKAAKRLKKNNVSVDIVNFGEVEENTDLLTRFIAAVNSNDNSHLVTVEPGKLLSDVLISTPIFSQSGGGINDLGFNAGGGAAGNDSQLNAALAASQADQGGASAASGGGGGGGGGAGYADYGGIDPNLDPELAMALRMSMEEERARQEAEAKKEKGGDANDNDDNDKDKDKEKEKEKVKEDSSNNNNDNNDVNMAEVLEIDDEDEELLKALQMSMAVEDNEQNEEENFVDDLLNDLPGLNADDVDNLDELLGAVDDDNDDNDKDKSDKDKKDENK